MKFYSAILALTMLAGCGNAGSTVTAPKGVVPGRSRAALQASAVPIPGACRLGVEGYAVSIRGFPEYSDTTFYYAFAPLSGSSVEVGGSIDHPLFRSTKQLVELDAGPDSCGVFALVNQVVERGDPVLADPITVFPDGTHYSKYQLTSSHAASVLERYQSDCAWAPGFNTTYGRDTRWMGELLPLYTDRNTEFRKAGWRLIVNEVAREGDSQLVNAFHLFGPGRREMIVSHVQAFPICP